MDINEINIYLLKKKEKIIIEQDANDILSEKVPTNIVLGALANLETWGYTVDRDMVQTLLNLSENTFMDNFYIPLVDTLKEIKGDDVSHDNFLFKNFPDSCRNMDPSELSELRFMSYYTGLFDFIFDKNITHEIEWDGEKENRKKATISNDRIRTIKEGKIEDFTLLVRNLLSSRAALSPFDKEIIEFALKSDLDKKDLIPDNIPFKENWAYLFKFAFENPDLKIPMEFRNFNDFKRALVGLSDGDISLSEKPMIRKFKRNERKRLLMMLDKSCKKYPEQMLESMATEKNRRFIINVLNKGWHMTQDFPKQTENLYKVSSDALTRYSKRAMFEKAIKNEDIIEAAKIAAEISPGELMRKLNLLLCKSIKGEDEIVLQIVKDNIHKVPIDIILNTKNAIEQNEERIKVAFPKGQIANATAFENKRLYDKPINTDIKAKLYSIMDEAIVERLKNNKPLGKVFVDENLKECPIPFSSRNENGENRCATRGTSFKMHPETKCIRAFCYKQIKSNPNFVDLSATFLNKNFEMVEQCSWTNLRTKGKNPLAVHSGDNPNCKNGLTEFIDINIPRLKEYSKEKGVKYVTFQVLSYGQIPFKNMDRCFFGIMERDGVTTDKVTEEDINKLKTKWNIRQINNSHIPYYFQLTKEQKEFIGYQQEDVFNPATVEYRNDIVSDGIVNLPMIYDIENEKFIIVDLNIKNSCPFISEKTVQEKTPMENGNGLFKPIEGTVTVENLHGAAATACYAITNMKKPNMYDLAIYNTIARKGELVDSIEEADTIFTITGDGIENKDAQIITVFDRDVITADLLKENPLEEEITEEIEK